MEALIAYFKADRGRRVQLAKDLGITPGAISQWLSVPRSRAEEIERITGIPRHQLCPDFFEGYEPSKSTEAA